jgi:hypothetical protein
MFRDGSLVTCRELNMPKTVLTPVERARSQLLSGNGLGEVTGERELQRIHDENLDRLASMNEREILAEKEKLLNSLGKRWRCACR